MIHRICPRSLAPGIFALVLSLGVLTPPPVVAAGDTLPARLTDEEFWKTITDFSESDGSFQSDNLLSNEQWFQYVIPDLIARTSLGGVYIGVGPEQNFTYIAAIKPKMVFITDIRRGNLRVQLMYKALFELSSDRADFMSKLFTKPRPAGLGPQSTAAEIQNAFFDAHTSGKEAYEANLKAIDDVLLKKHKLPLTTHDIQGIHDAAYHHFYWYGPNITYSSSSGRSSANYVTYSELMMATDANGVFRSFLASEDNFRVLKNLQERNLVIPLVGDFAGPKALRSVGKYLRSRGATVSAFYLSNVEQYLHQYGSWPLFCANVASLPLDEKSTFIRSRRGYGGPGGNLVNELGSMMQETSACSGREARPLVRSLR